MPLLKILFLLPYMGRGGAEMHTLRLINGMDRTRFRPMLACMRAGGDYLHDLREDVPRFFLSPAFVKSSTAGCFTAILPLANLLRKERPDVVLPVLPQSLVLLERALRFTNVRPRVIACIQNNLSADYAAADAIAKWTWCNDGFRRMMFSSDRIVCLSTGVADDIAQRFPRIASRLEVVPNIGCEPETFDAAAQDLDRPRPEGLLVVACGRLERQKDYPTLLEAIAEVRKTHPVRLWILGRGSLESVLKQKAVELGIENAVEFLGFRENPYRFMHAADVFVISSRWEGFGNVIVEAMACGVPVVATDCPFGPSEILDGGRFGRLVPVGDVAAFAHEVSDLLGNPAVREDLAARGRSRARSFLPSEVVPRYERVIEAVAPREGGSSQACGQTG